MTSSLGVLNLLEQLTKLRRNIYLHLTIYYKRYYKSQVEVHRATSRSHRPEVLLSQQVDTHTIWKDIKSPCSEFFNGA